MGQPYFDSTPTTLLASRAFMEGDTLVIEAVDIDNDRWTGRLQVEAFKGGRRMFAESLISSIGAGQTYPLSSVYDDERDEWYCVVGNYGIHSNRIEWTEGWDD